MKTPIWKNITFARWRCTGLDLTRAKVTTSPDAELCTRRHWRSHVVLIKPVLINYISIQVTFCLGWSRTTGSPEGCTMKEAQHSQAFFAWSGSTKPKSPVRDNRYHDGGYQFALLTQDFFFRLCACSLKKCYLTILLHKVEWSNVKFNEICTQVYTTVTSRDTVFFYFASPEVTIGKPSAGSL